MTQLNNDCNDYARKKRGVIRMKRNNLRIDMTPMVDLGFLLISFFVITTELSKPTAMDLFMPKDGPPMDLGDSNAMTILLDKNNTLFCYYGDWESANTSGHIFPATFSGKNSIRDQIIRKQAQLSSDPKQQEGREGLMLLIKATEEASYENLVDILDEVVINEVKKYAVVKLTPQEINWLRQR